MDTRKSYLGALLRPIRNYLWLWKGVLVVAALAIVFWIVRSPSEDKARRVSDGSRPDRLELKELSKSQFDEFLVRQDSETLAYYFRVLDTESSKNLPVFLDRINKKIAIADRILMLNENEESNFSATEVKLQSLISLELAVLENDLIDEFQVDQLETCVNENLSHESSAVVQQARIGSALAFVSRYLRENSNFENRDKNFRTAIEKYQMTVKEAELELSTANNLKKTVKLIYDKGLQDEYRPFLTAFVDRFGSDPQTKQVAQSLLEQLAGTSTNFQQISRTFGESREGEIDKLVKQMEAELGQKEIRLSRLPLILENFETLILFGKSSEVTSLAQRLVESKQLENNLNVKEELRRVLLRADLINKKFDLTGIATQDGKPVEFGPEIAKHQIVFVASAQNHSDSVRTFRNDVWSLTRNEIGEGKLGLGVLFIDNYLYPNQQQRIKAHNDALTLAKAATNINVWFVDAETDSGKQFLERFPVPGTPLILILNDQQEILYYGPMLRAIEDVVFSN